MSSFDWADPSRQYADWVMNNVQVYAGNTDDGRPRNAAPFYVFGAQAEQSGLPPTQLPAVQWRQSDGALSSDRKTGGAGSNGCLGVWQHEFEIKVYGKNRAQVSNEVLYLFWAIRTDHPDPPIADIKTRWLDPGLPEQNGKETCLLTFSAPVLVPAIPQGSGTILVITSSLAVAPTTGSVTGSYTPSRTVVVH